MVPMVSALKRFHCIQIINSLIKGTYHVIEFVWHIGFRSSCPFCSPFEVFLYQFTICPILKEATSPCHGSFDDLVSNSNEDVPGHCSIKTSGFKVGCFIFLNWKKQNHCRYTQNIFKSIVYVTKSCDLITLYIGALPIWRKIVHVFWQFKYLVYAIFPLKFAPL